MTAPALDALRDIHLPPLPVLVTALPPWWLAAAALVLLVAAGWLARRWLRLRPLRAALRELAQLASFHARDADTTRLARGVSRLLRRYAMTRFVQPGITTWKKHLKECRAEVRPFIRQQIRKRLITTAERAREEGLYGNKTWVSHFLWGLLIKNLWSSGSPYVALSLTRLWCPQWVVSILRPVTRRVMRLLQFPYP